MSILASIGGARDRPDPRADVLDAAVRLARIREQMFARSDPARIAHYHVTRRIGGGAMGLVFAAWDPSLDRTVAIKVLREPDDGGGKQLRAEAQALARLGHPNVVTVFEVGEHDGQLYLAMEYVEGQTLREWVTQWRSARTRDWTALRGIFIQAARGLAAAHSAGVVHRDVKPQNVMIDGDGRVRVMDFGLARENSTPRAEITGQGRGVDGLRGDLASTHTRVCGTPAYMAPEQFEGRRTGAAADQFALGASLFEAIYGRRLRSDTLSAAATAHDPIELPAERGIPRALRATVARLLAIAPQDRFASMDQVVAELSRQGQHRATRWAAAAIGTLIAATGVAAGFAINAPDDPRCTGAAEELAGVWDEHTAAQIESGLHAEGSGLGASTWAWVGPKLDAYSQAWVDELRETCEARWTAASHACTTVAATSARRSRSCETSGRGACRGPLASSAACPASTTAATRTTSRASDFPRPTIPPVASGPRRSPPRAPTSSCRAHPRLTPRCRRHSPRRAEPTTSSRRRRRCCCSGGSQRACGVPNRRELTWWPPTTPHDATSFRSLRPTPR